MSKLRDCFQSLADFAAGNKVLTKIDPETGVVTSEEYRQRVYGLYELHRTDGPAIIKRDSKTGIAVREEWHDKDKGFYHRVGGPAVIVRDSETGVVIREEWWQDNSLHRINGPALIDRDPRTGAVTSEMEWRNGRPIIPPPPTFRTAPWRVERV